MINKKIAMSLLSVVTALAMAGGATYAYFSDVATSTGNTFSSGTLDLRISDNDETGFGADDQIAMSFKTPDNWAPGETYTDYICFKNNNGIDIEQVLFKLNQTSTEASDLDNFVYVSNIELGDVTNTPAACNAVGTIGDGEGLTPFLPLFNDRFAGDDSKATLTELFTQIDGTNQVDDDLLNGPAKIPANGIMKFRVEWTFDPSADESVAGKTVTADMEFIGTQDEN